MSPQSGRHSTEQTRGAWWIPVVLVGGIVVITCIVALAVEFSPSAPDDVRSASAAVLTIFGALLSIGLVVAVIAAGVFFGNRLSRPREEAPPSFRPIRRPDEADFDTIPGTVKRPSTRQ